MHDVLDPWLNPVTWAVPFFLLFIGIELAALKWLDHDDVTGYQARDASTSILMGLGSLVSTLVLKAAAFFVYVALYLYVAPWHLPMRTWWSWALVIVGVDLAYYWQHRFVHRARVGWAAHQAHHSSEYMNFATALRQKWNPWFDFFFWLPLPLLGVAPWAIYFAYGINLVYQFFVHTETIRKLPRPVEFIFNTPSHHRVHHGSRPRFTWTGTTRASWSSGTGCSAPSSRSSSARPTASPTGLRRTTWSSSSTGTTPTCGTTFATPRPGGTVSATCSCHRTGSRAPRDPRSPSSTPA